MFGTEAIWWLNSTLLAALTHAGVFWMLAFAEPENTNQPFKTTIIIETLPVAEDLSKLPGKTEIKPIEDRVAPARVDEREKTKTSNDSDQIAKVSDQEQVVNSTLSAERAKKTENVESVDIVSSNTAAARPAKADDASSVRQTTKPVRPEPAAPATAPEVNRAETIEQAGSALTLNKVSSESQTPPKTLPERPTSVQSTAKSPVTPSSPKSATRVATNSASRKVAVLRQKPELVQTANPAKSSSVRAEEIAKPTDEKKQVTPQKKFVFPKNVKRLAPASTKPSKTVEPQRLATVETNGTDAPGKNATSASPLPQRLKQVAIANTSRAGRVEPDSRYRDLLRFLEESEVEGCATVLPTIAKDGSVALSGFAADEGLWASFQASMTDELRIRLPLNAATVAKPQCRALTFARTLPDYPRFSLGMKLENTDLVSGQSLEGRITDARGRKVHLVVVDDEGLVQQIDGFLQPKVSSLTFSVAVSVRNQVVPTAQMLIALAVERPLETVTSANQTLADQFFAAVTEELAATNQKADIAIVSFYLRSAEE